ncbi:MAG TPA: DUF4388 domain-containing protein, partial [Myxococcaceae bacterium]|nr:DUF4388 domain-containing protein [Myxococcaceae bacterium]
MSSWFSIDSSGHLAPESSESRQELSSRPGRFVLAPTGPDLLCLLRVPPKGAPASTGGTALVGDAATFPTTDLIAFLNQARWTGVLRLYSPNGERSIVFKDGEVRGGTSDDPADRLGEVIVRLGFLSRRQVDEALGEASPMKIGRALVEKGVLQPHDLWRCVTQQLSDIFQAIVLCREGSFVLVQRELDEKSAARVQLSTQSLLMDSIRRIDEMAHFRKRIAHGRLYVLKKRASDGKLEEDEDRVLSLVNGERTVLELGHSAKLSEFDVTKIVFRLLEGGYATVAERSMASVSYVPEAAAPGRHPMPSKGRDSAASAKEPLAVVRVFNFIFREIRDEVAKQGMDRQFIASANAALAGQALSSSPVLSGVLFDSEGNLDEGKLMRRFEFAREQLGSEPIASLRQALSDVMFFLLFQAGELLESRADED